VNIACLCDVDERVYPTAARAVEEQNGSRPPLVRDLRRILDDPSVDRVAVATPDHWHAPATILACQAGKHVYVEKPAGHNLREGRLMVEAARLHKRVVQLGTQSRSRASTRQAMELIRSGKIGHQPDSAVPAGVDYDTWVGPATSATTACTNWTWRVGRWTWGCRARSAGWGVSCSSTTTSRRPAP
jgi:predicted dehydrogenase